VSLDYLKLCTIPVRTTYALKMRFLHETYLQYIFGLILRLHHWNIQAVCLMCAINLHFVYIIV